MDILKLSIYRQIIFNCIVKYGPIVLTMCGLYFGRGKDVFMSWKSDLYSNYIFAVLFAMSCDTGQCHNNKPGGIEEILVCDMMHSKSFMI